MPTFRACIYQIDNWYVVQCLEVDIASQGGSEPEALANLEEALKLHFEPPSQGLWALPSTVSVQAVSTAALDATKARRLPLSFAKVRFKLEAAGFRSIRQRSNHAKLINQANMKTAILPHYTELTGMVIDSILRQATISAEEFENL